MLLHRVESTSFSSLSNIPLHVFPHSFSIGSCPAERLACLHVLATVNDAAAITEDRYLIEILISVLLDKYSEMGLSNHRAVLVLRF